MTNSKVSSKQVEEASYEHLYRLILGLWSSQELTLKAGRFDALELLASQDIKTKILGLARVVLEDPSLQEELSLCEGSPLWDELHKKLAEKIARQSLEEQLEQKVEELLAQRQEQLQQKLKLQILEQQTGYETQATRSRFQELVALEEQNLQNHSLLDTRPSELSEVIGQESAVHSLMAKLGSPYPQHVILYGPPGVGKTSTARLVLEAVKNIATSAFKREAPFVEVDATTMRWDAREMSNPLLGSVHDPIYQGASREMGVHGIPEPKLGLVTKAHGGILFMDEIGELEPLLQNKLLKVLEDKRVRFDSSYYDPNDPRIPEFVHYLFSKGAPADFILVGATTRLPSEINPALRSRCSQVFFEPLTPSHLKEIVAQAAEKLGVELAPSAISEIASYCTDGRKAVRLLTDAYGEMLLSGKKTKIAKLHVSSVVSQDRLPRQDYIHASEERRVGSCIAVGLDGFIARCLEIETAVKFCAEGGSNKVLFNSAAGKSTRDAVYNALGLVGRFLQLDTDCFTVHCNIVGGAHVDGPSAGLAFALSLLSSFLEQPIPQDFAVTGEVSLHGHIKPVGGIRAKVLGAFSAGYQKVMVPEQNFKDVGLLPKSIEVVPVAHLKDACSYLWKDWSRELDSLEGGL